MKKLSLIVASALALTACETVVQAAQQGYQVAASATQSAWNNLVKEGEIASINQQQANLPPPTLSVDDTVDAEYKSASQAYQETVVQGAILGGLIAGGACKFLANANDTQTGLCVAGGAVLGGIFGDSVAKKNKELVQDRENVVEALDQAKANRTAAQNLLDATEKRIATLNAEIERLDARLDAKLISEDQYKSDLLQAKKEAILMGSNLNTVNQQITKQKAVFEDLETQTAEAEDANVRATTPMVAEEVKATGNILEVEMVDTNAKVAELTSDIDARLAKG